MILKFRTRRGALQFLAVVILFGVGYVLYPRLVGPSRAQREAERRRIEEQSAAARVQGEIIRRCWSPINDAVRAAFPTGVLSAAEEKPADLAALRSAPFVERDRRGILVDAAAPTVIGHSPTVCVPSGSPPSAAPPAVVGIVQYACQATDPSCAGAVGWLDVAAKKALGVIKAKRPVGHARIEIERDLRAAINP